jgi:long-chain acyl-CoA synthetase
VPTTEAVTEFSGGPGYEPEAKNLYEALLNTVARQGDAPAVIAEEEGVSYSWNDLAERVKAIAGGFNAIGVRRGDTISLLMNNRSDFIPTDLAAVSLGAVPFSIYQTSSPEQIEYLLKDSAAKVMVVEQEFLPRVEEIRDRLPDLEHLIVLDGEGGTMSYDELMKLDPDFDPLPRWASTIR